MVIKQKVMCPLILLGLLGCLWGAFMQQPAPETKDDLQARFAAIDATLLFHHREAVAALMGERNPHQVAAHYLNQLPMQLQTQPETQSLVIFDRTAVIGGVEDLTDVMAEKYSQLMDINNKRK